MAVTAEWLVDNIDGVMQGGAISQQWVGLILLPIVGNAAGVNTSFFLSNSVPDSPREHVTAVTISVKVRQSISHLLSRLMVCIKGQTDPQSSCCWIKHREPISHYRCRCCSSLACHHHCRRLRVSPSMLTHHGVHTPTPPPHATHSHATPLLPSTCCHRRHLRISPSMLTHHGVCTPALA